MENIKIKFGKGTSVLSVLLVLTALFFMYSAVVILKDSAKFKATYESLSGPMSQEMLDGILRFEKINVIYGLFAIASAVLILLKKRIGAFLLGASTLIYTFLGLGSDHSLVVAISTLIPFILIVIMFKDNLFKRKESFKNN